MNERKCSRCGDSRVESGFLEATGRTSFKPEHTKFLTLHTSDVSVRAYLCLGCGAIDLVGDVEKARALLPN